MSRTQTPSPVKKKKASYLLAGFGDESNSPNVVQKAIANSQQENKTKLHQAMLTPRTIREVSDWISKEQTPAYRRESKETSSKDGTPIKQLAYTSLEENTPMRTSSPIGLYPATTFSRIFHGLGAALDSIGLKNMNQSVNQNNAKLTVEASATQGKSKSLAVESLLSLEKLSQLLGSQRLKGIDRPCLQPLPLNLQPSPSAPPNSPERPDSEGDQAVILPTLELEASTLNNNNAVEFPFNPMSVLRPSIPTIWKKKKEPLLRGPLMEESSEDLLLPDSQTASATTTKELFPFLEPDRSLPLRAWEYKPIKSHFDLYRPMTLRYPSDDFPFDSTPVFRVESPARNTESTRIWRNLSIYQSEEIYRWIKIFEDVLYVTVRFMLKSSSGGQEAQNTPWTEGELWKELQWPQGFFVEHLKQCYLEQFGQPSLLATDEDVIRFLNTRTIICSMQPNPKTGAGGRLRDWSGSACYMTSVGYGSADDILDIRRFDRHIIIHEKCRQAVIGQLYQLEPKLWDPHQPYAELEERITFTLNPPIPWLKWDHSRKMFTGIVPTKMSMLRLGEQRSLISKVENGASYCLRLCIQAFSFDVFPDNIIVEQTIKAEFTVSIAPLGLLLGEHLKQDLLDVLEEQLPLSPLSPKNISHYGCDGDNLPGTPVESDDPILGSTKHMGTSDQAEPDVLVKSSNEKETSTKETNYFEVRELGGYNLEQCVVVPTETMRNWSRLGNSTTFCRSKFKELKLQNDEDGVESSETELSDDEGRLLQHIPYIADYRKGFWNHSNKEMKEKPLKLVDSLEAAMGDPKKTKQGALSALEQMIEAYDTARLDASRSYGDCTLPNCSSVFGDSSDILPVKPQQKFAMTLTNMLEEYVNDYDEGEIEDQNLLPPPLSSPNGKVSISKEEMVFSLGDNGTAKEELGAWAMNEDSDKENWDPSNGDKKYDRRGRDTGSSCIIIGQDEEEAEEGEEISLLLDWCSNGDRIDHYSRERELSEEPDDPEVEKPDKENKKSSLHSTKWRPLKLI